MERAKKDAGESFPVGNWGAGRETSNLFRVEVFVKNIEEVCGKLMRQQQNRFQLFFPLLAVFPFRESNKVFFPRSFLSSVPKQSASLGEYSVTFGAKIREAVESRAIFCALQQSRNVCCIFFGCWRVCDSGDTLRWKIAAKKSEREKESWGKVATQVRSCRAWNFLKHWQFAGEISESRVKWTVKVKFHVKFPSKVHSMLYETQHQQRRRFGEVKVTREPSSLVLVNNNCSTTRKSCHRCYRHFTMERKMHPLKLFILHSIKWVIIVSVFAASTPCAHANPDAKRLYDDLLSTYNRLIRPVSNNTDTILVKLGLRLSQLIDLVSLMLEIFT